MAREKRKREPGIKRLYRSGKDKILGGVCGGIAAYKILELIPRLRKRGIDVSVIMTGSATKMIDPHAFEKASGNE